MTSAGCGGLGRRRRELSELVEARRRSNRWAQRSPQREGEAEGGEDRDRRALRHRVEEQPGGAVLALPYYWDTNPGMIRQASHALEQVLADDLS
jgi:hypothetical protein